MFYYYETIILEDLWFQESIQIQGISMRKLDSINVCGIEWKSNQNGAQMEANNAQHVDKSWKKGIPE